MNASRLAFFVLSTATLVIAGCGRDPLDTNPVSGGAGGSGGPGGTGANGGAAGGGGVGGAGGQQRTDGGPGGRPGDAAPSSSDRGQDLAPGEATIVIVPREAIVPQQRAVQLNAYLQAGGMNRDITAEATWSVSDPMVASIVSRAAGAGFLTGLRPGEIEVRATLPGTGISPGLSSAKVVPARLSAFSIMPATSSVAVGARQSLTAMATFSDGTVHDVTEAAQWTSRNPDIASVSALPGERGRVTGRAAGQARIEAEYAGMRATAVVNVSGGELKLTIDPPSATRALRETIFFGALATQPDGTTANVTSLAEWSSSDTTVASVGPMGRAQCLVTGTTTVTVRYMGATAMAMLECGNVRREVVRVLIGPDGGFIPITARRVQLSVYVYYSYSDQTGTRIDSRLAQWSSSDESIATVSTAGVLMVHMQGMVTIKATYSGVTGEATFTVVGQ
jgi:trimeric autotransporter adhesin